MQSVFTDKAAKPSADDLKHALGETYQLWEEIAAFTRKAYPEAREEWNFPSSKYGWSFTMSDKKRVIVYLLPREGFFKVGFVFGQKATDEILNGEFGEWVKKELRNAPVYGEGRGIRLEVRERGVLEEVFGLVRVKLAH